MLTADGELQVGRFGHGTLSISEGGIVEAETSRIGVHSDLNNSATISGVDSTWSTSGSVYVGDAGTGYIIQDDGLVTSEEIVIGNLADSFGGYIINDGFLQTNNLLVGKEGRGTIEQYGGAVVVDIDLAIGHSAGGNGSYRTYGGRLNVEGNSFVGKAGLGSWDISGYSEVDLAGNLFIGSADGIGDVAVSQAELNVDANLTVGLGGFDMLNIDFGGIVTSNTGEIGGSSSGEGFVFIQGSDGVTDSSWTITNDLRVGSGGEGTLVIKEGADVSNAEAFIGVSDVSQGTVIVDGGGSTWTNTASLWIGGNDIGNGGTGTLTIQNSGTVAVANQTTLWSIDDGLTIDGGTFRTGSWLNQNSGNFNFVSGTFAITNDDVYIGTAGTGSALGTSFVVPASSTLEVSNGNLTVGAGGTLAVSNDANVDVASETVLQSSTDTLTIDGGTFRTGSWLNQNSGNFIFVSGTFGITNDNVYVGTSGSGSGLGNSFTVPASSTLEITGGQFTVNAGSTLTLSTGATVSAGDGTNQGSVQLTNATLDIAGDFVNHGTVTAIDSTLDVSSEFFNSGILDLTDVTVQGIEFTNSNQVVSNGPSNIVNFRSSVTGEGDFLGDGLVLFQRRYRPGRVGGLLPEVVEFAGNLDFSASSLFMVEIEGNDNSDPSNPEYDSLEVAGELYIHDGAQLFLDIDTSRYTPKAGDTFDLITAGSSANSGGNLGFTPTFFSDLPGDLEWQLNHDWAAAKVTATIVTPYSADFEGDGDVDQDDLSDPVNGWEARYGVDLDGSDYLAWQRQLGSGVAPLLTATESVPEPRALVLLFIAISWLSLRRQCTQ